jgi:hypothetical protein
MQEQALRKFWAIAFCVGTLSTTASYAQHEVTPCTLVKDVYTCNLQAFKGTLAAAQTISIQSEPMDQKTQAELAKLARHLGKTVTESSDSADLQFLLIPLNKEGIYIGDGDTDLATLRVYAGGSKTHRGSLVWAETYRGKKDMPFPSAAYYLIQQFQARLSSK